MADKLKVSHESESQLILMWRHVYNNIQNMIHPHHFRHEPGGSDEVRIPLGYLRNVTITSPKVGEVLVVDTVGNNGDWWVNGEGGAGKEQVHFSMPLPATVIPPGPTNITGGTYKIHSVLSVTDDSTVAATLSAGTLSIGVPCSRTNYVEGSEPLWADGETMTLDFSDLGLDGTYITVDVAVSWIAPTV